MKILNCIPTLEYGGAERQLCYLTAELTRRGHEVHVACVRRGPLYDRLAAGGAIVHDLGRRRHHDPRLLVDLIRLIRKLRPDVVQSFLMQMDVAAGAAALLTRNAWVLCEESSAASYPPGWKSSVRRLLGKRAAAIVSNSHEGDAYWLAAGASRRHIVMNAVPFAEIDAIEARRDDCTTLLFAGRMDDGKNARTLVDALSLIAGEVDFVAILCGDGPQRPALERVAAERGLVQRILFPGYVGNVWELMKRAHVLVSLSRFEGTPNVVLEAMACRCPLVVSGIAAHRALLDDASALFVDADDAAAAAAAIRTTLLSRGEAEARARAARVRAERFSIEAMARSYESIFEAVRKW
jgi:glycosyltransferase involved in cell wall biosynthesis